MSKEIERIRFYKNIFRTNKTYVEIEDKIQASIAREFEEEEALYLYAIGNLSISSFLVFINESNLFVNRFF